MSASGTGFFFFSALCIWPSEMSSNFKITLVFLVDKYSELVHTIKLLGFQHLENKVEPVLSSTVLSSHPVLTGWFSKIQNFFHSSTVISLV